MKLIPFGYVSSLTVSGPCLPGCGAAQLVICPLHLRPLLPHNSVMTQSNIPAGSIAIQGCATSHLKLIRCFQFTFVRQLLTLRVGLILSIVIILAVQYIRSPWRKVPPGPKGLPVLGNVLELKDKAWLFKKDCKRKFRGFIFVSANHYES